MAKRGRPRKTDAVTTNSIYVRMGPELIARLDELAEHYRNSRSGMAEYIIKEYLDQHWPKVRGKKAGGASE